MGIQQEIRFCTSFDGVQLATALHGTGAPLVKTATWLTHIERDMDSPHARQWIDELSRQHTFITYDTRGCGLSDRAVQDVSLDTWVRDLEAVVDSLKLERFPLLGISCGGATAVAYAAKHPERVSHLILFGAYATSFFSTDKIDPIVAETADTMLKVARLGWGTGGSAFRQVFVSKFMPHASLEQQRSFDEYQRLTATPEMAVQCLQAMFAINIKAQAAQVQCPTLVFHAKGDQLIHFHQGRKLASLIPSARFIPIESDNHVPFGVEACWGHITQEIRSFLGDAKPPNAPGSKLTARQTQVLQQVAAGHTDKKIAKQLDLSPRTIEMHVAAAMKTLASTTRAEAVHAATQQGLLH
jgi:pimeloyl-ACP methyl ester carboxylesterase/DNA-binding CsgD family transcriptional regulator